MTSAEKSGTKRIGETSFPACPPLQGLGYRISEWIYQFCPGALVGMAFGVVVWLLAELPFPAGASVTGGLATVFGFSAACFKPEKADRIVSSILRFLSWII